LAHSENDGKDLVLTELFMLRCGRGAGYRAALSRTAVDEVLACVVDDPRWDRQVEEREDYYATLLVRMAADVRSIVERIASSDGDAEESSYWLPVGVLAQMARRGHAAAVSGLAQCIRRGQRWRTCLDALEAAGGGALVASVTTASDIEGLLSIVGHDELIAAAQAVEAPWDAWASTRPALRFVAAARSARTAEAKHLSGPIGWLAHRLRAPGSSGVPAHATVSDLLRAANEPGPLRPLVDALLRREDVDTSPALRAAAQGEDARPRALAIQVLGRRGCVDYLADAKALLEGPDLAGSSQLLLRTSYVRYLQALDPALTLPLARGWLCAPWPLSHAAEEILAERATLADRVTLEHVGEAALAAGEMYRLCSMLEGLTLIGAPESVPFLGKAYAEAPYSHARRRALVALVAHPSHDGVSRASSRAAPFHSQARRRADA
jgi:hypothetical protein